MIMAHGVDNDFGARWVNLADPRLGAKAIATSDEFFAPKERLLNLAPAVFIPGKYDDHGKWMDGWESRRKRVEGHDWCIVRLGRPGLIGGVDIDTSHFTGNYPPAASLDACMVADDPDEDMAWTEILPSVSLSGNAHHLHAITSSETWSHVRLNIYPDGGVARLRVYGQVQRDWRQAGTTLLDLAAAENGGRAIACSDQHYGTPLNMLFPGRGANMGDGWETRRRRKPGNEWAIIALGHPGRIHRIEIDTAHFKGNYPDRCSIQAGYLRGGTDESAFAQSMFWRLLLPEQKMQPDCEHVYEREIPDLGPVSHVRLNSIPDGGISRLRLFGRPE
ncbi:MAG: allantoicase [Rhodospirillales bacterium]|nr:allantoicase [Rhodospirillales bacterium]